MFWNKHHDNNDDSAGTGEPVTDDNNDKEPCSVCSNSEETASLLDSTFHELEKERTKRKELEAQIAMLKKQQKQSQQSTSSSSSHSRKSSLSSAPSVPSKDMAALQAEAEGYQQIVHALTMGRPAIDAAVKALHTNSSSENTATTTNHAASNSLLVNPYKSLPLNSVQFLEIMPWHPKALETAMVTEELYEWQVYSADKKAWRSELAFFPTFFKALPVITPGEASRDTKQIKAGVWTNQSVSLRFDLRNGCVLPFKSGAPFWKWIGGWHVDSSKSSTKDKGETQKEDTNTTTASYSDKEGWSYAKEAGHFLLAETSSSPSRLLITPASLSQELSSSSNETRGASSIVRRRKWSRQRVLVDYPYACENTVHFLQLLAQGEELKSSNSLLETSRQEAALALLDAEFRNTQAHKQWEEERQKLEQRLVSMEEEHKVQMEVLERQRGPSIEHFPLPRVIFKRPEDSDTDSDDDTHCTSHSKTRLRANALLLHPEDGTIGRSVRGDGKRKQRRSFLFPWGKDNKEEASASPTPDTVELGSDEFSVTSCEDRDVSEQTTDDEGSVALFSSSRPSSNEDKKSFLGMFFGNHHEEEEEKAAAPAPQPAVFDHEGAQAA